MCFSKISEHSERCFVNFFDCSPYNFWRDTFNFCPSRSDYLMDSLLCDFIYFSSCLTDNFWNDFSKLIYSVSASARKVLPIEKTSCLAATFYSFFWSSFSNASTSLWVNNYLGILSFFAADSRFSLLQHSVHWSCAARIKDIQ